MRILLLILIATAAVSAQEAPRVLFYPKPLVREHKAPMKAITRLADVRAKHKGHAAWREPIRYGTAASLFGVPVSAPA